jgi:hypothetical protein
MEVVSQLPYILNSEGERSRVVAWSPMLQAGRSWDRFPMSLDIFFFNLPDPTSLTVAPRLTEPLTEMSHRNLCGESEAQPECKAGNLTFICEPTV